MDDARREEEENLLSGVVSETRTILGNCSYPDIHSRNISMMKRHIKQKTINEPLFKRLKIVEKDLYEVELLKSTIEHREFIICSAYSTKMFQYFV